MKFRAKLTIAMVLLLSLTYGIGGSLMIAQSFSSSIDRERDAAVQTYRMIVDVLDLLGDNASPGTAANTVALVLHKLGSGGSSTAARIRFGAQMTTTGDTALLDEAPEPPAGSGVTSIVHTGNGRHYLMLGDTASFLLDDATGCVLALSYEFAYDFGFQIRQNDLWDYLLCVFENRVGATVAAALGEPYDEVQIPMPDAAQKMLGLRVRGTNTVPMRLLNAGEEGNYNDGMDSSITDYLQFYDPDADTAFSLPAWRVENTLYFNAQ